MELMDGLLTPPWYVFVVGAALLAESVAPNESRPEGLSALIILGGKAGQTTAATQVGEESPGSTERDAG